MSRKYRIDAFDDIDNISAYWLGFYFSDGCLCNSGGKHSVILSSVDKEVIVKLKSFYEMTDGKMLTSIIPESGKKYYTLGLHNKVLFDRLVELGCYENKSLILDPPKIDSKYTAAFLLGVIDGDGSISRNKTTNQWKVSIGTGSKVFADWIYSEINKRNLLPSFETRKKKNNFYTVTLFGNSGKIFLDELYSSVPKELPLTRKYQSYLSMGSIVSGRGPDFQDWEVEILLSNKDNLKLVKTMIESHPKNYGWARSIGTLGHKRLALSRKLNSPD